MLVEIVANGQISRALRAVDERHALVLDELARLLYRLRRTEAVVQAYQGDLPAFDTAAVVDHLDVGKLSPADSTPRRGRTAIGHRLADLDLGIGDAGRILATGNGQSAYENEPGGREARRERRFIVMLSSRFAMHSVLRVAPVIAPSAPRSGEKSLRQFLQQHSRLSQDHGIETFGEPAVDRRE